MFLLKKPDLEKLTRETGFIQNSLEKMLRLIDLLKQLTRHPFLKRCFALKGGTALNLFVFNLPRLSVDVDLNYVNTVDKDAMLAERRQIATLINELYSDEYHIELTKDEHALMQFDFHYSALSGSHDKLKLEINYLLRQPIVPIENRKLMRLDINLSFPCLAVEELLAGKVIALLSRYTPRDLFDVYQAAISLSPYNVWNLRSLIIFYGLISRASIFDLFEMDFDRITKNDIRRNLTPLIAKGHLPERIEMVEVVEKFLKPFTALSDDESQVIKDFYKSGVIALETLFPNLEIQNNLKISPALHWKIQNIQQRLQSK